MSLRNHFSNLLCDKTIQGCRIRRIRSCPGRADSIYETFALFYEPFASFLTIRELPGQVLQLPELRKLPGRSPGAPGPCPEARGRALGNAGPGPGTPRPGPETSGIGPGAPGDARRGPGAPGPRLTLTRNRFGLSSW